MKNYNERLLEKIKNSKKETIKKHSEIADKYNFKTQDKELFIMGVRSGYMDGIDAFTKFLEEIKEIN